MSLFQKIAHNTAWQAAGKVLGTLLGLAVATLLIRYLKETGYGYYTTSLVYLQLFGIIMDLGLYIVLLKHIALDNPNERNNFTNNIITLRFVSALALLIIACILIWFIPTNHFPAYTIFVKVGVLIAAANTFFVTVNQLLMGIYQHHLETKRVAIAEVAGKIILFVTTVIVIYVIKGNVWWVLLTLVISTGVNFWILWSGLKRYQTIHFVFNWPMWRRIITESWPVAIAIALNLIYFKADTIVLSLYYNADTIGVYGFPYKILEVIITLPAIVAGLIMPQLGAAYKDKDLTRFKELYQRAFYMLALIAIPMMVGAEFTSHGLMTLIAGPDLRNSIPALGNLLQILILAVGAIFIGTLTGYVVVVVEKQKTILWGYGFVAVTALAGYFYFIPKYSYYGAAWVTVYSEITMMCISAVIIYLTTKARPTISKLWPVFVASACMGTVLWLCQSWPVVVVILIGIVVYPVALIAIGGISKQELKLLLSRKTTL